MSLYIRQTLICIKDKQNLENGKNLTVNVVDATTCRKKNCIKLIISKMKVLTLIAKNLAAAEPEPSVFAGV